MELRIKDRDYVADRLGGLRRVDGWEELLERVLFRLSVRRGSFPFAPTLGSELHLLGRERADRRATAARQYAAEALVEEAGLEVTEVAVEETNGPTAVRVSLRYGTQEGEVRVETGE